jgi:hypothetical protein
MRMPRITIRGMMIIVALAGIVLAHNRLMKRRADWHEAEAMAVHAERLQLSRDERQLGADQRQLSRDELQLIADQLELMMGRARLMKEPVLPQFQQGSDPFQLRRERCESRREWLQSREDWLDARDRRLQWRTGWTPYHSMMAKRYRAATWRPWILLEPCPEPPSDVAPEVPPEPRLPADPLSDRYI